MDPRQVLDELAHDTRHGASEITTRALAAMRELALDSDAPIDALAEAGAELIRAHPAMAPLVHLADAVLHRVQADGPKGLKVLRAEDEARRRALAQAGAALLDPGDQVATYSRSGTVLAALRHAVEADRRFSVLVSEARPGQEGLLLARDVVQAGVPVTLCTDAALVSLVREADKLIVGADAICAAGLVNKIGTGALVREAARADVPAYVLAGTDKLLPPSYRRRPPLVTQASMGHDLPAGAWEAGPVFECEPLDPIEAIVTEDGRLPPDELHQLLAARTLHPALQRALKAR